jgi:hypothetical protein
MVGCKNRKSRQFDKKIPLFTVQELLFERLFA